MEPTSIKGILSKLFGELHEVTFDESDLIFKTFLHGIFACTPDLELVVVHANNLAIRELRNLASRSANTTANVKDAHARFQVHLGSKVVLMPCQRSQKRLSLSEARKVERLGPAILVQLGSTVIVSYVSAVSKKVNVGQVEK